MGRSSQRKRKNRHGGGGHHKHMSNIIGSMPAPPPLPEIDVPAFKLTSEENANDTDDSQMKHPTKKPKKEKQRVREIPEFCVSPAKLKRVVRVSDLQELVLWLLADGVAAQWLLVKRKQDIKKVVVVMVPGFDMALLDGTVDLVCDTSSTGKTGDEDIGEVIERSDGDDATFLWEVEEASLGAGTSVEVGEEGEIMETEKTEIFSEWTIVGNRRDPDAKPFSFYPSLLSGRPLPPCLVPLRNMFTHVWPTKMDGDDKYNKMYSPISHFLNCPIDKNSASSKYRAASRIGITELLMTAEELFENEYPMHSSVLHRLRQEQGLGNSIHDPEEEERRKAEGWIETPVTGMEKDDNNEGGSLTEGRKIYSVDCEMCNTEAGPELTRISVVGWDGNVVYDTLVKPSRPIIDYLTNFSGITKSKLEFVTTTLSDVQTHLLQLFQPAHKVVLVGQSLNSDLKAIKLVHPYVVDTSVIFEHSKGKPYKPSLKWLAMKYLKREIQKGQHLNPLTNTMEVGHDSIEDARACVDLVKMKLEKGLSFGNIGARTESIFTRIERGHQSQGARHKRCWGAVVDHGNPMMIYGQVAKKVVSCQNDDDVVNGIQDAINWKQDVNNKQHTDPRVLLMEDGEISFVWARLRELEVLRGWDNANRTQNISEASSSVLDPPPRVLAEKVKETVSRLQNIYNALPSNTAFIVYSGTGDPREMARLNALQRKFREEYKIKKWDELDVKWTDDEQQALHRAVKKAREGGLSLMTVKVDEDGE